MAGDDRNGTSSLVETLQEFVGLDFNLEKEDSEDITETQDSVTHNSRTRKSRQGKWYTKIQVLLLVAETIDKVPLLTSR